MPDACCNCGSTETYRKLNKQGTGYIILCSKCAWEIRKETREEAFVTKEKAASGN